VKLRSKRSTLHARAELMIPWLVNGSLRADAEPALSEHIASCPECRQDYEEQLRVRDAMCAEGPLVFAAESSYQKLLARIRTPAAAGDEVDGAEHDPWKGAERDLPQPTPTVRQTPRVFRWLAAAVILQAFAIGLGAWVWHSHGTGSDAPYATLTSSSPSFQSGLRARVVFRADLSLGALQKVLQGVGAHIIDGPADGDVYTLGFAPPPHSPAALHQRIAVLRANSAVLFAEPLQDGVH
jgi:hypothetical protein